MDAFSIRSGSHYAITKEALKSVYPGIHFGEIKKVRKIPLYQIEFLEIERPTIADVLLDGVRDVDFYQFEVVPVHAQTNLLKKLYHYTKEEIRIEKENSIERYINIQRSRLEEIRFHLKRREFRLASYQIGLFIHSLQDLQTHQGVTNRQHRALSQIGQNPDKDEQFIQEASEVTKTWLQNLPNLLGEDVVRPWLQAFLSGERVERLSLREKSNWFGRSKDVFWSGIAYLLTRGNEEDLAYHEEIKWPIRDIERRLIQEREFFLPKMENRNVGIDKKILLEHLKTWIEKVVYWPGQMLGYMLQGLMRRR